MHALVRETSRTDHLRSPNVTIFRGDVADAESMKTAFAGVDYVVHAAADTTGSEEKGRLATIQGTRNMLELCREFKVKKLIYISSCSVYGTADYRSGQVVSEDSSLERFPDKRGAYSRAKLRAEELVARAMADQKLPIVCLRPGTFFGPGGNLFFATMGFRAARNFFVIIGSGGFVLPLVCIENLADAIVACLQRSESDGRIYNVIDGDMPTKRHYVNSFLKKLYPDAIYLYIPYPVFYLIVGFQEILFRLMKRNPLLTIYRLKSSQKNVLFDASRIRKELSWTPPTTMQEAYNKVIEHEQGSA